MLWGVILAIVVGTFVARESFIVLFGRLERVPPGNERLVAGAAGALVAWRTENLLATVVVGMAALWALRFVV